MPENKMNPDRILSRFLDEITAVKGANLSKVERLVMRDELRAQMDRAVDEAMIAALPEDKLVELNRLVDEGGSEDEIDEFFAGAGIDFDKVALSAMLQFKKDQLRDSGKEAERGAGEAENAEAENLSYDMTQNTKQNDAAAPASAGAPVQGTVSAQPGMSNVEGVARMVAGMSEGGENA